MGYRSRVNRKRDTSGVR